MSDTTEILEDVLARLCRLERAQKRGRNQKEAAHYLHMSVSKLQALHREGRAPRRSTIGRTHTYLQDDLDAFLKDAES
jgi:hypothetical protein